MFRTTHIQDYGIIMTVFSWRCRNDGVVLSSSVSLPSCCCSQSSCSLPSSPLPLPSLLLLLPPDLAFPFSLVQSDTARVLRSGQQDSALLARELVPGDIVELRVGDKAPADMRILRLLTSTLRVEQASLTGESAPVLKSANIVLDRHCELQVAQPHLGVHTNFRSVEPTFLGISQSLLQVSLLKSKPAAHALVCPRHVICRVPR